MKEQPNCFARTPIPLQRPGRVIRCSLPSFMYVWSMSMATTLNIDASCKQQAIRHLWCRRCPCCFAHHAANVQIRHHACTIYVRAPLKGPPSPIDNRAGRRRSPVRPSKPRHGQNLRLDQGVGAASATPSRAIWRGRSGRANTHPQPCALWPRVSLCSSVRSSIIHPCPPLIVACNMQDTPQVPACHGVPWKVKVMVPSHPKCTPSVHRSAHGQIVSIY